MTGFSGGRFGSLQIKTVNPTLKLQNERGDTNRLTSREAIDQDIRPFY